MQAPPNGPKDMVRINGGAFNMGCDDCEMPDAKPIHKVSLDGFWIDPTPVTNAQFAKFVAAKNYVTIAERKPNPADHPDIDPQDLVPGSAVFIKPEVGVPLTDITQWWKFVPGANWKHPEGPDSNINEREDHPVVQVAWEDAKAYCEWSGKRLPTEAEFEYAARGGDNNNRYSWGNEMKPQGKWQANIWQGQFPSYNSSGDGFIGTSPVKAFSSNKFGLYDMGGNIWQWCSDWYTADYFDKLSKSWWTPRNPQGPSSSLDPREPNIPKKVLKGGSFLCSDQYCSRYIAGSRGKGDAGIGSSNIGFRCVK